MTTVIRQAYFAICACLFALLSLTALIVYGDGTVRKLAIAAALVGCISQFVAQDLRRVPQLASVGLAYTAFFVALVALLLL